MPQLTRTSYSVRELTKMYATGEIAIPEIQRDFVWDAKRIRLLLDSIQKDYPSGAIILWQPQFKRIEFEMLIRPERLHLYKKRLPKYLLLDGQQRLTALSSVILPADEVSASLGEEIELPKLFLNLKTLAIEARKDSVPSSNNDVLLNRLLSDDTEDSGLAAVLIEISPRKDITVKHRKKLKEFRDRILEYNYPVQILVDHDYKTVAEIFRRVNSQGKILITAEIELAKIVPHWRGFSKNLRTFIKEMRSEGFKADLPLYMRCLAFIATNSPAIDSLSKKVAKDEYSRSQLERYWGLTKNSISALNRLLRRNKIDRTELITTRNALVPIVYAISKDKNKSITDALFIKWLIYSMDGGHYSQKSESILRKDSYYLTDSKQEIGNGFERMLKHMIREDLESRVFDETDFEGTAAKNPALLFIYLGLRHYSAKDFCGQNSVPIEQIVKYQIHHIFPLEFMLEDEEAFRYSKHNRLSREKFKEQINDVANLTFLSLECNQEIKKRPPYNYLPQLTTPVNLTAHCIPQDPELWKPGKYDEFCKERRRLLAKAMNLYIKNLE